MSDPAHEAIEARIHDLLAQMTLGEKIGQLSQVNGPHRRVPDNFAWARRQGWICSILNEIDVHTVNEIQRVAVRESRLGIPLRIRRDLEPGAGPTGGPHRAARSSGVRHELDLRDDGRRLPRPAVGGVAECPGEDPHLASALAGPAIVSRSPTPNGGSARLAGPSRTVRCHRRRAASTPPQITGFACDGGTSAGVDAGVDVLAQNRAGDHRLGS
jgi:hypothetical protein